MNDHSTSIALDKNGNIIVTGYCQTLTQSTNIVTVKYSPAGVQQWVDSYNYQGFVADEPHAMVTDTAGYIYVAGSSGSFLTQIYDCVLLKYNTVGTLLWSRGYGNFTGAFYTNDLILDRQGYIYVVGTTNVPSGNSVFLLKYNSSGDTIWTKKYKEPGYDINAGLSLAIDSLNNILIGGHCAINNNYAGDCLLIKYSASGNYIWSATYNSGGVNTSDIIYKVGIDNSGNLYAVGAGFYDGDYLIMKYNSAGIRQWIRTYSGSSSGGDYAVAMAIDGTQNIYITGTSYGASTANRDYATIKYNTNGDSLWVERYNGTGNGNDEAYDLFLDDSDNVYITGSNNSTAGFEITTIKYSTYGNQIWVKEYPGRTSQFYTGKKIAVDRQRNIYVNGDNSDSATGSDYVTIKYSQLVGLTPITSETPQEFKIEQNYPNPFNPKSNINFQIAKLSNVKLTVFDILGREITTLVNQELSPGTYEVDFDGSYYPSGVYFYKLVTEDYSETRKMVLLK